MHGTGPVGRREGLQHAADVDVDVAERVVQLAGGVRAASVHDAIGDVGGFWRRAGPGDRGRCDVDADHGGEVRGQQAHLVAVAAAEVHHRQTGANAAANTARSVARSSG